MGQHTQLFLNPLRLAPGAEWEIHGEGWTLALIQQGEAYLLGKGTALSCPPGSIVVVAGGGRFELRASRIGGAVVAWFRLDPASVFGVFTLPERRRFESPESCSPPLPWILPPDHPAADLFRQCLEVPSTGALDQRGRLLQVFARVLFPGSEPRRHPSSGLPDAGDRLMELVNQLTDSELFSMSFDELAELCRCDRRRMLLVFREKIGDSLPDRQDEWRRLKACSLLSRPGASVGSVAKECGYSDPDAFRAWFRRQFGMPPARWIRENGVSDHPEKNPSGHDSESGSSPERHDGDNRP